MRYLVVYEKAGNGFGAFSPDVPGCYATGASLEETRRLMREAIGAHLDVLRGEGLPVPDGRTDLAFASAEIVDVA